VKPLARRAALALLAAGLAAYGYQAARTGMWPFESQRKALAALLGGQAPGWLKDAELAAWEPDPDSKAQRWFASAPISREDFLAWAPGAGLKVLQGEKLPPSVWTLPDGVQVPHWTGAETSGTDTLEAKGLVPHATLWARWSGGRLYLVAYPSA
jgi:hypothetical protein